MKRLPATFFLLLLAGCGSSDREYQGQTTSFWISSLEPTTDPEQRGQAIQVLVAAGPQDSQVIVGLIDALKKGSFTAAEVLARIGPGCGEQTKDVVAALAEAIRAKKNNSVRLAAARALPKFRPAAKPAVPALVEMLRDPEPGVRGVAAESLGNLLETSKEAVGPLLEALNDPSLDVKHRAKDALEQIDPEALKGRPQGKR